VTFARSVGSPGTPVHEVVRLALSRPGTPIRVNAEAVALLVTMLAHAPPHGPDCQP
jgi:hypothetical protein